MVLLKTFISNKYRPDIRGGTLDAKHKSKARLLVHSRIELTDNVNCICFGPKKDNVLLNLEHAICSQDNIYIFYYEDIHVKWSYAITDNQGYFVYKKNDEEECIIRPKNLYIRSCYIEPDDQYWSVLGDFFNFVDMWNGYVLCSPKKQANNESKPFQLNSSLLKAAKGLNNISIGQSYIVKGKGRYKILNNKKSYIVKSISGIRSIVVDEQSYDCWDKARIDNIPVLFQEKVFGDDLRVHIINNKTFAKLAVSKSKIDYRYDKSFFNLITIDDLADEIKEFCINASKEEDNLLLGIDFIKSENSYVVLEANPSPGWSAYHDCNAITVDSFIKELLWVLKNE